ncbi:NAD(P)/FAD-dependent oxidoreductase [Parvularcula oceani]|uniref:NAD(P)/FAD-dependent oxidoreductase n=1 Tax=Parvularcula oceani TaxID=1247963 RepID=UPI0004E12A34|nr:FAD-dependent oxidoreductase [Parvularcula oceani]
MSETVIAGGGLAGACAAFHLARAGRAVTVVERSAGPHDKVCGEFLSAGAAGELSRLGIDLPGLGAHPLMKVRIASRVEARGAALPFEAWSLSRRRLDEAALSAAEAAGARILRGSAVTAVEKSGRDWRLRLSSGETAQATSLLLATGKHDLRGRPRPESLHSGLIGLKRYYRLAPAAAASLRGSVDVAFFPGGYCGFQLTESGEANACLVVSRERLADLGGDPGAVFRRLSEDCPHAAELLSDAEARTEKPLAIARIPYGYVRFSTDGAYYLGDQAAVIPSFCGEGMALSLRSGRLGAEAVLNGVPAELFQRRFGRLVFARVKGAALLSRLLVRGGVQRPALALAALAPGLVTQLAAATRTPQPSSS